MNEVMKSVVRDLLNGNEAAKAAHLAMLNRGLSKIDADAEIGRALLGCLWEVNRGMVDRLDDVFNALARGLTCVELFPDELYED